MKFYVAGNDKPHRCPDCWQCSWRYRPALLWRLTKYLPRQCQNCGAITLTTALRHVFAREVWS